MAKIVCVDCGAEIGTTNWDKDIAAGRCDKCRRIQGKVEELQDECKRNNEAARRVSEIAPEGCGTTLALMALGILAVLVVVL